MIASGQISLVVQGPIVAEGRTAECLRSLRKVLPGAQIILSTWKGSPTAGLDCDVLIESDDPGGFPRLDGVMYNLRRQITSTLAGLGRATREYTLKFRPDCLLNHDGFLRAWEDFPLRAKAFPVFSHRLIATDHFFCDVGKPDGHNLFHISDIVLFGLTADLKKLWEIPMPAGLPDIEIVRPIPFWLRYEKQPFRYIAEQWIWLRCLQKHRISADLDYHWQYTRQLAYISEASILNNFQILSLENFGVNLPLRLEKSYPGWIMEQPDWERLYQIYCANDNAPGGIKQRLRQLGKLHRQRVAGWLRYQIKHYSIRIAGKLRSFVPKSGQP